MAVAEQESFTLVREEIDPVARLRLLPRRRAENFRCFLHLSYPACIGRVNQCVSDPEIFPPLIPGVQSVNEEEV